jgi:hypothetical protein
MVQHGKPAFKHTLWAFRPAESDPVERDRLEDQ